MKLIELQRNRVLSSQAQDFMGPALPAPSTAVVAVDDAEWSHVIAHIVDALPRLAGAALPQFTVRGAGSIVVISSAAALRGRKRTYTHGAACGLQIG